VRPAPFVQLRRVGLHPAPNAAGIDLNTAFRYQLGDVFVGERITEIPTHAQNDHFSRKLATLEGIAASIDMGSTLPIAVYEVRNGTAKRTSLANCSDSLPNPTLRLNNFDLLPPRIDSSQNFATKPPWRASRTNSAIKRSRPH
jgi:hypothetical protein